MSTEIDSKDGLTVTRIGFPGNKLGVQVDYPEDWSQPFEKGGLFEQRGYIRL